MGDSPLEIVAHVATALNHSPLVLGFRHPLLSTSDLDIRMWLQSWSDTKCGFGGTAGQAFTRTTTILCAYDIADVIAVFIGGKYAYSVLPEDKRRSMFMELVQKESVPGAAWWKDNCSHQLAENSNVCRWCDSVPRTK